MLKHDYLNPSCNHKIVNTLLFVPPMLSGSCATMQRVWAICVLPILNSPKASVMDMVGILPVQYNGKLLFEVSSHSLILYKFKFNKFKKKIPPKALLLISLVRTLYQSEKKQTSQK